MIIITTVTIIMIIGIITVTMIVPRGSGIPGWRPVS